MLERRPSIRFDVAAPPRVGQPCELRVLLDAPRAVHECEVVIDIECELAVGRGDHERFVVEQLRSSRLRLPAGESEARLGWTIPADLPTGARYFARVRVDLPWWPDAEAVFDLPALAPHEGAARQAETVYFSISDDNGGETCQGTFEWNVLRTGGRGRLRLAFADAVVRGRARGRVRAELTALLRTEPPGGGDASRVVARHVFHTRFRDAPPGWPVEVPIRVPTDAPPSFTAGRAVLYWRLEILVQLGWRSWHSALAVDLVDEHTLVTLAGNPPAPTELGDAQAQRRWLAVALHHQLRLEGARLTGRAAGALLRIDRLSILGQLWLVAELEYPSLELGLRVHQAQGRPPEPDLALGQPAWDRRHFLDAPDHEQVRPFLAATREALAGLDVEVMGDTHARLRRLDSGDEVVRWFTVDVVALAEAIARGRLLIPPPTVMSHAVPAWLRLAQRLSGRLSVATMRVDGEYESLPAQVATVWTGERQARFTRVQLTSSHPLRVPEPSAVEQLARGALDAGVSHQALFVDLPAPLVDAEEALAVLARLARLYHALRLQAGAYR